MPECQFCRTVFLNLRACYCRSWGLPSPVVWKVMDMSVKHIELATMGVTDSKAVWMHVGQIALGVFIGVWGTISRGW